MSKMTLTALAAAAALSACSLMPAYEAPLVNIPERFAYDVPQEQAGVPPQLHPMMPTGTWMRGWIVRANACPGAEKDGQACEPSENQKPESFSSLSCPS